jgi:two-component system nitrogen regulation response regulator GlnG
VRQLQSVLKYAIVQATGDVIALDCLPENLRSRPAPAGTGPLTMEPSLGSLVEFTDALLRAGEVDIYRCICQEMDRVVLATVMRHVQGNQVKASELLGISRTTLRAKLRSLKHTGDESIAFNQVERTE